MPVNRNDASPFELLRDYEARSLQDSGPEGAAEMEGSVWTGIAYRLAGQDFVTRLDEIREVIHPPEVTAVPGAQNWILGLANVHGTLLPVVDLQAWLGIGAQGPDTPETRVIVAQHADTIVGILVDGVLGMRNFQAENESAQANDGENPLARYCSGAFGRSGRTWHVLSFEKLLSRPEFLGAAVAA